jgi:4-hydroxy-tetrahydrodipicolinate reductase
VYERKNIVINIALSGALGKMGQVIYGLTKERTDCRISVGVDINAKQGNAAFPLYDSFDFFTKSAEAVLPDVVIDFSHPLALKNILMFCRMNGVPAVIATTGYNQDDIAQIRSAAEQIPVFFTFNMSLGINLLADLVKRAAKILGNGFDIEIIEKHHNLKKDAPSGTALMLAEAVCTERTGMKYIYDRHSSLKAREKNEIGFHSVRGGTIVGDHDVIFAGHDEVITLSHSAQSKEVFAAGALNAAIFLAEKTKGKKGLYDMGDLIRW